MSTPLKGNQVRAYTNAGGITNYYIVIDCNGSFKALWFRGDVNEPMHLSTNFMMSNDHPVVFGNINSVRNIFTNKLDK